MSKSSFCQRTLPIISLCRRLRRLIISYKGEISLNFVPPHMETYQDIQFYKPADPSLYTITMGRICQLEIFFLYKNLAIPFHMKIRTILNLLIFSLSFSTSQCRYSSRRTQRKFACKPEYYELCCIVYV